LISLNHSPILCFQDHKKLLQKIKKKITKITKINAKE
jgi:hypothetical protein